VSESPKLNSAANRIKIYINRKNYFEPQRRKDHKGKQKFKNLLCVLRVFMVGIDLLYNARKFMRLPYE